MQLVIDLYVKAVDLAKQGEGLSNQDKMILNKFKILLLSGATGDADRELAQIGKVRKDTIHKVRELAESIFEDWVRRNADISDDERERILEDGKKRADTTEDLIISELKRNGLIIDTIWRLPP